MTKKKAFREPETEEYRQGFDAGMHKVHVGNCNFTLFLTPKKKNDWERGYANGKAAKRLEKKS